MPRILFLNNQGLNAIGGGPTILRYLVNDLSADCAVTLLSVQEHDAGAQPGDASVSSQPGLCQLSVAAAASTGRLWRVRPMLRACHLARVVPTQFLEQADVTVVLDCHFAPLLRRHRPRRLIYLSLSCIPRQEWFSGAGSDRFVTFLQYLWLERILARSAGTVIVSSETHASELRKYELMPRLHPMVLPPAFSAPPIQRRRTDSGCVTLLSAGRLEPLKNYRAVIDLAERLRNAPCRFVIAGEGPEATALQSAAAAAGVADRVEFVGPVTDTARLLSDADLFVHPSRYESFGMAVLEAMQAGVPAIVPRNAVAGYREFARDGIECCSVDFDRPDEAAAALHPLLFDKPRRQEMGEAAKRSAERMLEPGYTRSFRRIIAGVLSS